VKTILNVAGMTCGHCEKAVTTELLKLDGVSTVTIDLASSTALVESEVSLNPSEVVTAIDEAGYELISIG